jgi:hypothetical protein
MRAATFCFHVMSWKTKMAHCFTGDRKHLGSVHRDETTLRSYRFGRRRERYGRGLSALHRANSYLKALIQSMANTKFRRMLRELELWGTRLNMGDEFWIPDALRDREPTK